MTTIPKLFRSRKEVEGRANFSFDTEISIHNFKGLVGLVQFPEEDKIRCQVRKPDGRRCRKVHWNGWVAVNQSGDEGYIGGVCANRDFKNTIIQGTFEIEKKKVWKEIRLTQYLEVLSDLLSDRDGYERRLTKIHEQMDDIHYHARGVIDTLPRPVVEKLREMHRTANNRVAVEYCYVEKDKKGREYRTWLEQNIGTLQGVGIVDFKTTLKPLNDAESLIKCLNEVRIDRSAGKDKLKEWSETLGRLNEIQTSADDAESQYRAFTRSANMQLLLLLVRNQGKRAEVARYLLRRQGNDLASLDDGRSYIAEFDASLREANKNRDFRLL